MAEIVSRYARRSKNLNRAIINCFLFGASTHKVMEVLRPVPGEDISASTVSRLAKTDEVAAFYRRKLNQKYVALEFDGVYHGLRTGTGAKRHPVQGKEVSLNGHSQLRTGTGAKQHPVLVVLGITADGRKEIIDYRIAMSESEDGWTFLISSLQQRGLCGRGVKLITIDGNKGLYNAIQTAFPNIPIQLYRAHKTRNLLNLAKEKHHRELKKDIRKIWDASTKGDAIKAIN